ncbi:PDZ domain-containing protein [Nannocystis punicea]|uniref:PDZ domain-containing protein n=1 Tax=Nannocystis punicea TaxID=2995304 RepID=A0ABY7H4X9_9BACT|nr:PDZ domain-containing protein [Nannocystis poenicansa]WAS94343.1 PDZ domain-containing protein [Nannocystis poenicansa]
MLRGLVPRLVPLGFASTLALSAIAACDGGGSSAPSVSVTSEQLKPGGVFITYVNGCEKGCDQLGRGDLVLELNGQPVTSAKDLRVSQIATGQPVKLKVKKPSGQDVEVEIVATPSDKLQPIKEAPPFWSVGAADLDKAPQWARRSLFGHASLMIMLMNMDGGSTDGRQMAGKKRLVLFWDWATRDEQAQAANMLRVLQMARDDLQNSGVDIMFTHVTFPSNYTGTVSQETGRPLPRVAPMNDSGLRDWEKVSGLPDKGPLPTYRFPNATEYQAARELGLEGATTYQQYLRQSPAIVLLDEDGIVRWHSEGVQAPPPGDELAGKGKDDQWTIIQAIEFAKKDL